MKRLVILALAVHSLALFAQPAEKKQPTSEEIAARRERALKVHGGLIQKPGSQQGRILFINAQKTVPAAAIEETVNLLRKSLKLRFDLEERTVESPFALSGLAAKEKAQGVIAIGEKGDMPSILTAPDERWAFVNVAPLKSGDVAGRSKKQLVRAFAFICGAASTSTPGTLMDNMDSLDRLDMTPETALTGDVTLRILSHLKGMGVTPYAMRTYKRACIEGWAPAPTNDYQKAVWQKVKEEKERGPAKPITIAPPSAKK